jgi:rhamnopyranosyl-N-acetylglucosaminyl-diphospho-decaprenol beta-1,3/1,4-galactofuranosyltransferase
MQRVCAVLVTYNRESLLREALAALRTQSRPVQSILVVDNAGTDTTARMLAADFPDVTVLYMPKNVGSSGGYHAGIEWALSEQFDWIWTLDDDSIPQRDALANLFACRNQFPENQQPNLLASKIIWTDGSLHPMNIQKPKLYNPEQQFLAAQCGAMSIRFTSFVSMLVHRNLIEEYGLPIAGYFMWNDDVEYSARILRRELGILVPASVVTHKTPEKHVPADASGGKFFYEIRNKLWIIRHSDAFDAGEKWWMAKSLIRRTWRHLMESGLNRISLEAVLRGFAAGIFSAPGNSVPEGSSQRQVETIAA